MPLDDDVIFQAIRRAVEFASGLGLDKIIDIRQNKPRPDKPYVTVAIPTDVTPYTPDRVNVKTESYTLTVTTAVEDQVYIADVDDERFEYTALLADTVTDIAIALVALVDAGSSTASATHISGGQYTIDTLTPGTPILVIVDQDQTIDVGDGVDSNLENHLTVSLLFYGEDSRGIARNSNSRLKLQGSRDALAVGGLRYFRMLTLNSVPESLEQAWEERQLLEFLVGVVSTDLDDVGTIDSVTAVGTIPGQGSSTPIIIDTNVEILNG